MTNQRLFPDRTLREDPRSHLWFLRLVGRLGLERFGREVAHVDDEILVAIGLRRTPSKMTFPTLRSRLDEALDRLDGAVGAGPLVDNIVRVRRLCGLSAFDADVLAALTRLESDSFDVLSDLVRDTPTLERALAFMLAVRRARVTKALASTSTLAKVGLISPARGKAQASVPAAIERVLLTPFVSGTRGDAAFVDALASRAPSSTLALEDFASQKDGVAVALALLGRRRRRGVGGGRHILLHGPPGTGKTELARLLAQLSALTAYEVAITDEDSDPANRADRLHHLVMTQRIFARRTDAVLVFDEAEDVFPREGFFGGRSSLQQKGYLTRLMETCSVPTIWITNAADAVDEAILRRFDLILEVGSPSRRLRRRLVERDAGRLGLQEHTVDQLVEADALPPAMLRRVLDVARTVKNQPQGVMSLSSSSAGPGSSRSRLGVANPMVTMTPSPDRAVAVVAEGFLNACGVSAKLKGRESVLRYDASLLNATPAIDDIVARLTPSSESAGAGHRSRPQCASLSSSSATSLSAALLLHGPPGTGKTAFARQLAKQTGRPLLERRGSDLLSKWLGETERKMAAMFAEAEDEGAVLFLDEGDTFLGARTSTSAAWQVSQTNELLTRMADFGGIFVCATNLVDALDPAVFRRFDLKVELGPLTSSGRRRLLEEAFGAILAPAEVASLASSTALAGLCIGDVVAAVRGLRLRTAPTSAAVLAMLQDDIARRERLWRETTGSRRPLGFTAA